MSPHRRLQNLLAYGQTTAAMLDAGATPLVQASFGDLQVLDGLQIVQHFGYSSSLPIGSNVVAAFGGGNKSKGVILGSVAPASRRRLLLSGETVVYDGWGNEAHFGQAGITVTHATQVTIATPNVVIKGALRVEGAISATGEVTANCDGAYTTLSRHQQVNGSSPTPGT